MNKEKIYFFIENKNNSFEESKTKLLYELFMKMNFGNFNEMCLNFSTDPNDEELLYEY